MIGGLLLDIVVGMIAFGSLWFSVEIGGGFLMHASNPDEGGRND